MIDKILFVIILIPIVTIIQIMTMITSLFFIIPLNRFSYPKYYYKDKNRRNNRNWIGRLNFWLREWTLLVDN